MKFLIDGLATYRLQRLITTDTITAPLRDLIFRRWPDPAAHHNLTPSYLVTCPHCTAVYAAALILLTHRIPYAGPTLRLILATSALTSLLHDTGLVKQEPATPDDTDPL